MNAKLFSGSRWDYALILEAYKPHLHLNSSISNKASFILINLAGQSTLLETEWSSRSWRWRKYISWQVWRSRWARVLPGQYIFRDEKVLISVLGWHCDRCNFGGIYTHTCGLNLPQINDSDSRNKIKESLVLCLKNTVFENPLNIDQKAF